MTSQVTTDNLDQICFEINFLGWQWQLTSVWEWWLLLQIKVAWRSLRWSTDKRQWLYWAACSSHPCHLSPEVSSVVGCGLEYSIQFNMDCYIRRINAIRPSRINAPYNNACQQPSFILSMIHLWVSWKNVLVGSDKYFWSLTLQVDSFCCMKGICTRSDTLPLQNIRLQTAMSTHHI